MTTFPEKRPTSLAVALLRVVRIALSRVTEDAVSEDPTLMTRLTVTEVVPVKATSPEVTFPLMVISPPVTEDATFEAFSTVVT